MFSDAATARSKQQSRFGRTAGWLVLAIVETALIFALFGIPKLLYAHFYARAFVFWAISASIVFILLIWQRRQDLVIAWKAEQLGHHWRQAAVANLLIFAALVAARLVTARGAEGTSGSLELTGLEVVLLALTVVTLLRIDVPLSAAIRFAALYARPLAGSAFGGVFVLGLAKLSQNGWEPLADATLKFTAALLALYESDVSVDTSNYSIRVGEFAVIILKTCSGYEGMGLIAAVTSIYLVAFRETLRFPNALLLLPIGIALAWLMNAVRIAALISLGAHVSPAVAADGFHSQGGWIAFLCISIGLVAASERLSFFSRTAAPHRVSGTEDERTLAFLLPLVALLASSIIVAAASPFDQYLYVLKVLAIGGALYLFRHVYLAFDWRVSAESVAAGVAVGAIWIWTEPSADGRGAGSLIRELPAHLAVVWLVLRVAGSVIVVPIAEELAFRGFLYRWLVSRNFEAVSFGRFSWLALLGSSLCFGLLHDRWLAAALAGAAFALVMVRSKRLTDAIGAHVVANSAICAWAIFEQKWELL